MRTVGVNPGVANRDAWVSKLVPKPALVGKAIPCAVIRAHKKFCEQIFRKSEHQNHHTPESKSPRVSSQRTPFTPCLLALMGTATRKWGLIWCCYQMNKQGNEIK
jgi:hypothetical protein